MPTRADRADVPRRCLVCGLDVVAAGGDPPWGEDGTSPTFDFCPCCGVEFGHADASLEGCRAARRRWLDAGARWDDAALRPARWSVAAQLASVPDRAR